MLCAVVLVRRLLQSFGNFQQPLFFFGNFAPIAGFNRAGQQEELFNMGKKCLVVALAMFAFGFGTALRSNAGTDMVEPYQAPARSYNYAPPPPPRPVALPSASSHRHPLRPGLRLLWAGVWVLRTRVWLRRPPVLRPTRLLARAPAITGTNCSRVRRPRPLP